MRKAELKWSESKEEGRSAHLRRLKRTAQNLFVEEVNSTSGRMKRRRELLLDAKGGRIEGSFGYSLRFAQPHQPIRYQRVVHDWMGAGGGGVGLDSFAWSLVARCLVAQCLVLDAWLPDAWLSDAWLPDAWLPDAWLACDAWARVVRVNCPGRPVVANSGKWFQNGTKMVPKWCQNGTK